MKLTIPMCEDCSQRQAQITRGGRKLCAECARTIRDAAVDAKVIALPVAPRADIDSIVDLPPIRVREAWRDHLHDPERCHHPSVLVRDGIQRGVECGTCTARITPATTRKDTPSAPRKRGVYKDAPVGATFGAWTVVRYGGVRGGHDTWVVRCECGRELERQAASIVLGRSAGCSTCGAAKAIAVRRLPTPTRGPDGKHKREYKSYCSMLARCYDERTKWWHRYGGRGIAVCDRWRGSFAAFVADMGPCPAGYSLERIDNDGDYAPGNCRWATAKDQARNTRRNRVIEIDGRAQCVAAWAEERGMKPQLISTRLRRGWSGRDAVLGRQSGGAGRVRRA